MPLQRPEENSLNKRKLLMPVIISSYASTNIAGRGNTDPDRAERVQVGRSTIASLLYNL